MAASRCSTATPLWSTRAYIRGGRLVAGFGGLLRRRDAPVREGLAALDARHALHDAVDLAALERLVLEQLGGDAVQQLAVAGDEVPRAAVRLEGQLALLLVADAAGEVRERLILERGLRRVAGAHRVLVDHRVGDLLHALQVAGGAGGHRAEDDLLGDPAAQ